MSTPSFWRGCAVALALSVAGALLFAALWPVLGQDLAARLTIAALAFAYLALLLRDSGARVGRLVTLAAWIALTALLALIDPGLWLWLLLQLGVVWLARCLYLHDSFLAALADAGLNGLALATGMATALHSGSVFLTLWSFFLVQAFFAFIPGLLPGRSPPSSAQAADGDAFEQAYRGAESALRRLSAHP